MNALHTTNLLIPTLIEVVQEIRNDREYCIVREFYAAKLRSEGATLRQIADAMNRHHTTVINSLRKFDADYASSSAFRLVCSNLENHV